MHHISIFKALYLKIGLKTVEFLIVILVKVQNASNSLYTAGGYTLRVCFLRYSIGVNPKCFLNKFWKWLWLEKHR